MEDMITPIKTMTINQIMERKDDLLVSVDDIKEIAMNERHKVDEETLVDFAFWLFSNHSACGSVGGSIAWDNACKCVDEYKEHIEKLN